MAAKISDHIIQARKVWLDSHGWEDPNQINNGHCSFFAEEVAKEFRGAKSIWDDSHGWHCFVLYCGKFYDSECPEGVSHPKDLPFFKRVKEWRCTFREAERALKEERASFTYRSRRELDSAS